MTSGRYQPVGSLGATGDGHSLALLDRGGTVQSHCPLRFDADPVIWPHRARQLAERISAGPAWCDSGLELTWEDGRPIHPDRLSKWFTRHARAAGLPEVGVHGLRHSHATTALKAGVSPHIVSKRLGHASVAITLDVYAHVFVGDDEQAADVAAAAILRGSPNWQSRNARESRG